MLAIHQMDFLALLLLLIVVSPSDSTIQKLKSIKGLKRIPFGQSVPKHSLALLHSFANTIELNNNNAIELNFDLDQGDYGTHYYENREGLLPDGNRYYTLGNLNHLNNGRTMRRLPSYFTDQLNHLMGNNLNSARILFSSWNQNTLDVVYLTQHQVNRVSYDPQHTYQITPNLLRELREFSVDQRHPSHLAEIRDHFGSGIRDQDLQSLRNEWGELACLGLLLFIVISEKNLPLRPNRSPATQPHRPPRQNLPPKEELLWTQTNERRASPSQNLMLIQNLPQIQADGRSASPRQTPHFSVVIPESNRTNYTPGGGPSSVNVLETLSDALNNNSLTTPPAHFNASHASAFSLFPPRSDRGS